MKSTMTISEIINFPFRIEDLITQHRDQYSMREANSLDFESIPTLIDVIDANKGIRATVDSYIIVMIDFSFEGKLQQRTSYLVGQNVERDVPWMTSKIKAVDFENGLVLTNNNLYKLGKKSPEVERGHIFQVCGTLTRWGVGERLGIPPVFF